MKTIDDALELRGRIFGAFELAELGATRGDDVDDLLTFVVVGAGPTGVEMAGQIAELAQRTLKRDFRAINTRQARVLLVDAAAQVLPPFGAKLGAKAERELERLGVEVLLGAMVTEVDERGLTVTLEDGRTEHIAAVTKIWAAGVQASSLGAQLAEQSGASLDRAGRIGVNPDLTLPGHPEVFVVGDMIDLDHLPGVAQVAIQGARYAAREIDGRLRGKAPQQPFRYFDKGSMAIISRFRAVAMVGRLRISGVLAWLMWLTVHLLYITGVQEPGDGAAALGGVVRRPRPGRADHHRAADLRPVRAGAPRAGSGRPGLCARPLRRRPRAPPGGRARGAGGRGGTPARCG